jgi:hypothetical protein
MHGGAAGSGAPKGNTNALKHGRYVAAARAADKGMRACRAEQKRALAEAIADAHMTLRQPFDPIAADVQESATLNLTRRQERFARAYVSGAGVAEAYRRAYNVRANTLPQSVASSASAVLANPKVTARVMELRGRGADAERERRADLALQLEQLRGLALEIGDFSAANAVTRLRAEFLGLMPLWPKRS